MKFKRIVFGYLVMTLVLISIVLIKINIRTDSDIETETNYPQPSDTQYQSTYDNNYEVSSMIDNSDYIQLTESELNTLATLVYLESGIESDRCQKAVASVIINRMTTGNKSLNDVVYEENQFSPAYKIGHTKPSKQSIKNARYVVLHGPTVPEYVTYFRTGHYHNFSKYMINYIKIDSTYFSYDINIKDMIER